MSNAKPISTSYFYFDLTDKSGPVMRKCTETHRISRLFFASYGEARQVRRMYAESPGMPSQIIVGEVFYVGTNTPVLMTNETLYAEEFRRILTDLSGPGVVARDEEIRYCFNDALDARSAAVQYYARHVDPHHFD